MVKSFFLFLLYYNLHLPKFCLCVFYRSPSSPVFIFINLHTTLQIVIFFATQSLIYFLIIISDIIYYLLTH